MRVTSHEFTIGMLFISITQLNSIENFAHALVLIHSEKKISKVFIHFLEQYVHARAKRKINHLEK